MGARMEDGNDWNFSDISGLEPEHIILATAIGHVALASAELEGALQGLLYRLVLGPHEVFALTYGETTDWLIRKIRRIIRGDYTLNPVMTDRLRHLLALLEEASTALQNRGALVHSTWGVRESGVYVAVVSRRDKTTLRDYTTEAIEEVASRLFDITRRIRADDKYGR